MRSLIALVAMVLNLFLAAAPVEAFVNGPRMAWLETFQASAGSVSALSVFTDAAGNIYTFGKWQSGYAAPDATFQILDGPVWTGDDQFKLWLAKFDAQHNLLWARNATQLPGGSDSQPNIDNTALSPDEQYFYAVGDKDTPSTLEFGGGVTAPACADNVFRCLWVAKWRASDGVAVAAISVGGTFQDPNLGVDSQSNVIVSFTAFNNPVTMDVNGQLYSYPNPSYDQLGLLMKLGPSLTTTNWVILTPDGIDSLTMGPEDSVFVSGRGEGLNFGNGVTLPSLGHDVAWYAMYSSSGQAEWVDYAHTGDTAQNPTITLSGNTLFMFAEFYQSGGFTAAGETFELPPAMGSTSQQIGFVLAVDIPTRTELWGQIMWTGVENLKYPQGVVDGAKGVVYVVFETQGSSVKVGSMGTSAMPAIADPMTGDGDDHYVVVALAASDGTPLWGVFPLYSIGAYDTDDLALAKSGDLLMCGGFGDPIWYTDPLDASAFSTPPLGFIEDNSPRRGSLMQIRPPSRGNGYLPPGYDIETGRSNDIRIKAGSSKQFKLRVTNTGNTTIADSLLILDVAGPTTGAVMLASRSRKMQAGPLVNSWVVSVAPKQSQTFIFKASTDRCASPGLYSIAAQVQVPPTATTQAFDVDAGAVMVTVSKGFKSKSC